MLKIWDRLTWSLLLLFLKITKTVQLRWVCMTQSTLLHVVSVSVATLLSRLGVVRLAQVSVVVGEHCGVLVDALWFCTTLALVWHVWLHIVSRVTCTTALYFIESYKLLQQYWSSRKALISLTVNQRDRFMTSHFSDTDLLLFFWWWKCCRDTAQTHTPAFCTFTKCAKWLGVSEGCYMELNNS